MSIKEVDDLFISRQNNNFDCGAFVAAFAILAANEWSLRSVDHGDMKAMRQKILMNICSEALTLDYDP